MPLRSPIFVIHELASSDFCEVSESNVQLCVVDRTHYFNVLNPSTFRYMKSKIVLFHKIFEN